MKIRKAEVYDAGNVSELVRNLSNYYLEDGFNELPEWIGATLTDSAFLARFNHPEYFSYVAEIDDSIIGYISVKAGFHLYHLFVASDFQNQGVARSLWQYCVDLLSIEQCIVRSSLFAVPVYSRFGFSVSGKVVFRDGIGFQPMTYSVKPVSKAFIRNHDR